MTGLKIFDGGVGDAIFATMRQATGERDRRDEIVSARSSYWRLHENVMSDERAQAGATVRGRDPMLTPNKSKPFLLDSKHRLRIVKLIGAYQNFLEMCIEGATLEDGSVPECDPDAAADVAAWRRNWKEAERMVKLLTEGK
jgi:hypothetical protein